MTLKELSLNNKQVHYKLSIFAAGHCLFESEAVEFDMDFFLVVGLPDVDNATYKTMG